MTATYEIQRLLSRSDVDVKDVLLHDEFESAIKKNVNQELLVSFLCKEAVFLEVASFCLTKKCSTPELERRAMIVFMNSTPTFYTCLAASLKFAEMMRHFLASEDSLDSRLCGNFSRIIFKILKWDIPLLFSAQQQEQSVASLLLSRINNNHAMQQLIVDLLKNYPEALPDSSTIKRLAQISSEEKYGRQKSTISRDASYTLVDIYRSLPSDSPIMYQFRDITVLNNILSASCVAKTDSDFLASDLISIVVSVINRDKSQSSLKKSKLLDFLEVPEELRISAGNVTFRTVATIDLYIDLLSASELFGLFFESPKIQGKLLDILAAANDMKKKESLLIEVVGIPSFIDSLVDCFFNGAWTPQCMKLTFEIVECFRNSTKGLQLLPQLHTNKWNEFVKEKIRDKIDIYNRSYGGRPPQSSDDDSWPEDKSHQNASSTFSDVDDEIEDEIIVFVPQCSSCCRCNNTITPSYSNTSSKTNTNIASSCSNNRRSYSSSFRFGSGLTSNLGSFDEDDEIIDGQLEYDEFEIDI